MFDKEFIDHVIDYFESTVNILIIHKTLEKSLTKGQVFDKLYDVQKLIKLNKPIRWSNSKQNWVLLVK